MQMVYTTDSLVDVLHLKNLLEVEGIACLVKNDQMYTLRAEVPFVEVWPQLWVARDADLTRARSVVEHFLKGPDPGLPDWRCAVCGEQLEAQFTSCWHCGAQRPSG